VPLEAAGVAPQHRVGQFQRGGGVAARQELHLVQRALGLRCAARAARADGLQRLPGVGPPARGEVEPDLAGRRLAEGRIGNQRRLQTGPAPAASPERSVFSAAM